MTTEELKSLAGKACIDLYLSIQVSQIKAQSEHVQNAWVIGQELYTQAQDASHLPKVKQTKQD